MDSKLNTQMNFYTEFKDWYTQIKEDFNFDYQKDCEARDYLSLIFLKKNQKWNLNKVLELFRDMISTKPAILLYGCGPSLEITVNIILKEKGINFFENFINLTADGASILLKEKGIKVNGIFTDLDGITKSEFHYGNFNIVHAHGDNIDMLKFFENDIITFENVIGTTQVEPIENLVNPGGFTDGDRILFFLRTLLSSNHSVFLIGMDFGSIIGKYSKLDIKKSQKANIIKQKKLLYAMKLIKWIKTQIKNSIYFVNSEFIVEDFRNLTIEEFLNHFKTKS
ncbi:MAG: 6-hydroxymethylpterin diphosphokinase MptE-like protein [Candidatus Hodarchaeota archaeon]